MAEILKKRELAKIRVEKIEIPESSLISEVYPKTDYADAFRAKVPPEADVVELARAILATTPQWIIWLLNLRNFVVRLIGLKVPPPGAKFEPEKITFEKDTRATIFGVHDRRPNEILMGEDDSHLNFRVSLLLEPERDFAWAIFSTVVKYNNLLGRLYFLPVRPFHELVVRAMLGSGARKLWRKQ